MRIVLKIWNPIFRQADCWGQAGCQLVPKSHPWASFPSWQVGCLLSYHNPTSWPPHASYEGVPRSPWELWICWARLWADSMSCLPWSGEMSGKLDFSFFCPMANNCHALADNNFSHISESPNLHLQLSRPHFKDLPQTCLLPGPSSIYPGNKLSTQHI